MTDSLIHLRVPAATKARWVRQSRAAGMKLTDWITHRVEAATMQPDTHETPDPGAPGEPAELARREALLDAIGGR